MTRDINPVNFVATPVLLHNPFIKEKTADGNTLYTVQYRNLFLTPSLTKLLLNENHEILAYIDIQHISPVSDDDLKSWQWFGIQEWHPKLIGEFKHTIQTKEGTPFFRDVWIYNPDENLYTLSSGNLSVHEDWYKVDDGIITTNYINGMTRSYKYNTRPLTPTDKIELLTKYVLYKDGVITKKEFNKYMRNEKKKLREKSRQEKYQNAKKQFKQVLTNTLTRKK